MKYTVFLAALILTAQLRAADRTVWFHGSLRTGSVNKEIDAHEYWGELDIQNSGAYAQTLTVAVHHHDGKPVMNAAYTVGPGEKAHHSHRRPEPERRSR